MFELFKAFFEKPDHEPTCRELGEGAKILFQVGDRVRATGGFTNVPKGTLGTVVDSRRDSHKQPVVKIEWDGGWVNGCTTSHTYCSPVIFEFIENISQEERDGGMVETAGSGDIG